jgi:PAS domain S-box-containing protein
MIGSRHFSLRWNLALIIFACVFIPCSIVITIAYDALYSVSYKDKIEVVGAAAQSRHETLKVLLQRSKLRADASHVKIQELCGSFKQNRSCYKKELTSMIEYVKAEGAVFISSDQEALLVGNNPNTIPRHNDYAKGQLAYFSARQQGVIPSYYIASFNHKNSTGLLISYSISALQPIFNFPKELGKSGETFLADSKGFFLSTARYKSSQGHGVDPISVNPMKRCLSSENGEMLDLDYRGMPIIHGFRYTQEIGGGCIMAHMEQAEAFSTLSEIKKDTLLTIAILTTIGVSIAFLLSRRIVSPINKLTNTITHFDLTTYTSNTSNSLEKNTYKEINLLDQSFHSLVKKLSAATKDSDALLRSLNYHAIVSMADKTGKITHVNDVFSKISGYTREELLGKNHRIINSGVHDKLFWKEVWTQISNGETWHGEVCNRTKNGSLYWVDTVIVPFRNIDNEIDKYVSIRFDITESKNNAAAIMSANEATRAALEELRITEERNAFALDGSGDGVWDWDIKNNKVMLSTRWKTMLGHTEDEIGHELVEWSSRLHPDDAQRVMQDVEANLLGKTESFSNQHRVRCKDGSYLWILDRGKVVARDENGQALRMVGTHTDISKQKDVERIKSELISTVSHELRTPITSIRGALGLIESGVLGEVAPKALDLIKVANRNSQRLVNLVNDILDMDKLLSGKMPLHIEEIQVNQVIQDALSANQSYADLFGIHFQFEMPSNSYKILADYNRLMQVFSNFLSNAAKFSQKGNKVIIRAHQEEKMILIEVQDFGEGIPDHFQNQVFEAFAQADSGDTRKQGSTGLGLNISKKLILSMNGEIGFTSKVKVGTTFWIKLPEAMEIGTP